MVLHLSFFETNRFLGSTLEACAGNCLADLRAFIPEFSLKKGLIIAPESILTSDLCEHNHMGPGRVRGHNYDQNGKNRRQYSQHRRLCQV